MNANENIEEEKPLDPATEKVRKKLVRFSAVFMGLNMLALMAVLGAIVYKIGGKSDKAVNSDSQIMAPAGTGFDRMVDIPDGAKIISSNYQTGIVSLTLQMPDGQQAVWFYNINEARISGKLSFN